MSQVNSVNNLGVRGDEISAGEFRIDAFEVLEHEKPLSRPEVDPPAMIAQTLSKLRERHDFEVAPIGTTLEAQVSLCRHVKLPPCNGETAGEILKSEAREQIPFPLENVQWRAVLTGEPDLDQEVARESFLIAAKNERVGSLVDRFQESNFSLDLIQPAYLSMMNYLYADLSMTIGDALEEIACIDIGESSSTLIIGKGDVFWTRSIPIGGKHFTQLLSREMKLTFAKAENLKRNARHAEDPKTIFQTLRPVFSDFVNEVDRSISFYQKSGKSVDPLSGIVLLGAGSKLFIEKQFDLQRLLVNPQDLFVIHGLDEELLQNSQHSLYNSISAAMQLLGVGRVRADMC